MRITLDLNPEIQAELSRLATGQECTTEIYAARLLEEAVHLPMSAGGTVFDKERAQAAAARIRELRNGVTLGGLTIRQLIDSGRRR